MANSQRILECRSKMSDRQCLIRVVNTQPWLVCESGGVRFVLPSGSRSTAYGAH
jgi:hypothetical protein